MNESIINNNNCTDNDEIFCENTIVPHKLQFEINNRDRIYAIIFTVLSVFFSVFGIFSSFSFGFTSIYILALVFGILYLRDKSVHLTPFATVCLAASPVLSAIFSVTSNSSVKFFSFCVLFILTVLLFNNISANSDGSGDLGIIITVFNVGFLNSILHMSASLPKLFTGSCKYKKTVKNLFFGIVAAIPLLIIILPLLISSDLAFSGFVSYIFKNSISTILKIGLGIVIAPFVVSGLISLKKYKNTEVITDKLSRVNSTVIFSFLLTLSICYLAYLFSQLAYFFSAFNGFLPDGYQFTVSEYARRGFFEMAAIAGINFATIFICLLLVNKKDGKMHPALRVQCVFIGIFTLIIIAAALSKMILYINSFGMTVLRLTTSAFMLFLAVTCVVLMLRCFITKINVLKVAVVTATCILSALGILNVNSIAAKYNYTAYINGKLETIDIQTLYELSDEGLPYIIKLTDCNNSEIRDQAKEYVNRSLSNYYLYSSVSDISNTGNTKYILKDKKFKGIFEMNVSKYRAYKALDHYLGIK